MPSLRHSLAGPIITVFVLAITALVLVADVVRLGTPFSVLLTVFDTRVLLGVAVSVFGISLLLYLGGLLREDPDALVHAGRSVEAVVPVYGEPEVLDRSVTALAASTYEDLTVTVVCEPGDRPSLDRAADLAAEYGFVQHIVNDRPGSKAGALNDAVERSDAEIIALFDADQEPHPKLIAHGAAALQDHDIARIRSLPRPTGLLESMAYYEYLLLFFLPQKLVRALLGLGIVGTRSVLLERSVFETVGQFDEESLTEDMDFTHRCHQADLSIRELQYYPCFEEPAHTLRDWWGQRVRWMTGHVSVCHRQVCDRCDPFDADSMSSALTLVGTFVAGIVLATTLPKLFLAAASSPGFVAAGLSGIFGIVLTTRAIDNHTAGTDGLDLGWLLVPVALTLFGLVVVQVVCSYVLGRKQDWYHAEKHAVDRRESSESA
jgi:cellulose synthase/poly-beta-1,6-N-acetylglucosamine synthase-like glycosyltransferase